MQQQPDPAGAAGEPAPRTTILPTKMRHVEAAASVLLWVALFPSMFYVGNTALNIVFLFLVITLMLHAYTMRPYCTEFDEEEEEAMMDIVMGTEKNAHLAEITTKEHTEEFKLVGFLIIILCTVGCTTAFSMGGIDVFHSWFTKTATDCSVADLSKLQGTHARFHCSDGFVDLAQQRSVLTKGGSLVKTYTAYRIAPVYSHRQPSKTDLPVAWTVSKNLKLTENPCGNNGLCGIFAPKESEPSDQASLKALKTVARDEVIKAGASDKFDEDSIPAVVLTSLADPEGKAVYFYVGMFFYLVVLIGLCNIQRSMLFETPSKLDADLIFSGNRPGYDHLNDGNERRLSDPGVE